MNLNSVSLTANLTRDPELRTTGGGTSVCNLRVACNTRRKDGQGNWIDKPNYFDITVFGAQAENVAQYLTKGSPVGIQGRLDYQEWEAKDGSGKRSKVGIIADTVQFLSGGKPTANTGTGGTSSPDSDATPQPAPANAGHDSRYGGEDDIPF